jgi:hypothetical protein
MDESVLGGRYLKLSYTVSTRLKYIPLVIVHNRDNGVLQTDRVGVTLLYAGVLVNPAEDLLVPHEAVLGFDDPAQHR